MFTVVFSVLIAASTISAIAPQFATFTNAAAAASELFELIDAPSKLDPLSDDGTKPEICEGRLEVLDLKFSYPSRPGIQVLNGLSLSILAGKTTALVGASGCGKSTLIGLLERWYERESGEILLDGRDITQLNTHWLRSQIGLVQQEPVLFMGTVFQNVANGFLESQKLLSREEQMQLIQKACETSNAHEFIIQLPEVRCPTLLNSPLPNSDLGLRYRDRRGCWPSIWWTETKSCDCSKHCLKSENPPPRRSHQRPRPKGRRHCSESTRQSFR